MLVDTAERECGEGEGGGGVESVGLGCLFCQDTKTPGRELTVELPNQPFPNCSAFPLALCLHEKKEKIGDWPQQHSSTQGREQQRFPKHERREKTYRTRARHRSRVSRSKGWLQDPTWA